MSLAIDTERVAEVLIGGSWYKVETNAESKSTFVVDSYEFVVAKPDGERHAPVEALVDGVPSTGFCFTSNGQMLFGPLTAIQAVRYPRPEMARVRRPSDKPLRQARPEIESGMQYEASPGHASPTEDTEGHDIGTSG